MLTDEYSTTICLKIPPPRKLLLFLLPGSCQKEHQHLLATPKNSLTGADGERDNLALPLHQDQGPAQKVMQVTNSKSS